MCSHTQLSKVATGILSLPPTSASVERSFSCHSHTDSSDHYCLSTERAAKLFYIAHPLTLDVKLDQTPQAGIPLSDLDKPSTLADAPLPPLEKASSSRCSSASSVREKSIIQYSSSEGSDEELDSASGYSLGEGEMEPSDSD